MVTTSPIGISTILSSKETPWSNAQANPQITKTAITIPSGTMAQITSLETFQQAQVDA